MKVVVDTNVLISAFVFGGNAERALTKVLAVGELVSSEFILIELRRVLTEKFSINQISVDRIVGSITEIALIIHPDNPLPAICRDPDDNYVLQLADFAQADFILTGDKDLLVLESFSTAKIVSPAVFLQ